jgi:hypothetical protein
VAVDMEEKIINTQLKTYVKERAGDSRGGMWILVTIAEGMCE